MRGVNPFYAKSLSKSPYWLTRSEYEKIRPIIDKADEWIEKYNLPLVDDEALPSGGVYNYQDKLPSSFLPNSIDFIFQVPSTDKGLDLSGWYQRVNEANPITINWGDGRTEKITYPGEAKHSYAAADVYVVQVTGKHEMTSPEKEDDFPRTALLEVRVNGTCPVIDFIPGPPGYGVFSNCTRLHHVDYILFPPSCSTTNFSYMFFGCRNLNFSDPVDIHNLFDSRDQFKTLICDAMFAQSGITSLLHGDMFPSYGSSYFHTLSCNEMFSECANLRVTGWDRIFHVMEPKNVNGKLSMRNLYKGCTNLTTAFTHFYPGDPIVYNADFSGFFSGCTSLDTYVTFDQHPISCDISYMFEGCTKLTNIDTGQLPGLIKYNGQPEGGRPIVTYYNARGLFKNSGIQIDDHTEEHRINYLSRTSDVDVSEMFYGCDKFTGALPEIWETGEWMTHDKCFYGCTNASNYSSVPSGWR